MPSSPPPLSDQVMIPRPINMGCKSLRAVSNYHPRIFILAYAKFEFIRKQRVVGPSPVIPCSHAAGRASKCVKQITPHDCSVTERRLTGETTWLLALLSSLSPSLCVSYITISLIAEYNDFLLRTSERESGDSSHRPTPPTPAPTPSSQCEREGMG